ncbi:MAG: flagellar basal body rod protein FlgC [Armatimonadetes bacterium]|jgi:flagellar basal-body rod protein FlgC|nr:flagellar basal body rod protein FlgC [Armatimonadota bacterium]MCA1996719.1 flagellar basal body rod protein FlgC [Armatimonadota bacterium]
MAGLNHSMRISASGMVAERFRMDVISTNIANANSMKVGNQMPYQRRIVQLTAGPDGVRITGVIQDPREFRVEFDPGNPNADAQGRVLYSNVRPIEEMVDMIGASRAYEANIAAFNAARGMIRSALNIGKV